MKIKYAKLKNNQVVDISSYHIGEEQDNFVNDQGDKIPLVDAIKGTETLEEMCDEFVLYDKDTKQYIVLEKDFYLKMNNECKKALCTVNRYIYGAIWITTESGAPRLEPIAKLNSRGEMELI